MGLPTLTCECGCGENDSECVHEWRWIVSGQNVFRPYLVDREDMPWRVAWCKRCGALMLSGKILAPAAARPTSTLASE